MKRMCPQTFLIWTINRFQLVSVTKVVGTHGTWWCGELVVLWHTKLKGDPFSLVLPFAAHTLAVPGSRHGSDHNIWRHRDRLTVSCVLCVPYLWKRNTSQLGPESRLPNPAPFSEAWRQRPLYLRVPGRKTTEKRRRHETFSPLNPNVWQYVENL